MTLRLRRRFGDGVEIERCAWSGFNTFDARLQASRRLQAQIKNGPTDQRVFIIAHSHGGNIALLASKDPAVRLRLLGIACLSTPFLHVEPRPWASAEAAAIQSLLGGIMTVCTWTTLQVWEWVSKSMQYKIAESTLLILIFALFLASRIKPLSDEHRLPHPVPVPLLILRMAGDEATAGLGIGTLLSSLFQRLRMFIAD